MPFGSVKVSSSGSTFTSFKTNVRSTISFTRYTRSFMSTLLSPPDERTPMTRIASTKSWMCSSGCRAGGVIAGIATGTGAAVAVARAGSKTSTTRVSVSEAGIGAAIAGAAMTGATITGGGALRSTGGMAGAATVAIAGVATEAGLRFTKYTVMTTEKTTTTAAPAIRRTT